MAFQLLLGQGVGGPEVAQQASHAVPRDFPDPEKAQDVVYSIGMEVPAWPGRVSNLQSRQSLQMQPLA